VAGVDKDKGHGVDSSVSAASAVPLRRWEDWERSRLKKIKREERRRRELARNYPGGFHENGLRATHDEIMPSFYEGSDTTSIASSADEDKWGAQIGAYNENHTSFPPPPQTLLAPGTEVIQNAQTVGMEELEAMLDQGFDTRPSPTSTSMENFNTLPHRLPPGQQNNPRFQLAEPYPRAPEGYGPVPTILSDSSSHTSRPRDISPVATVPPQGISSALGHEARHVRKRSNGETPTAPGYGPLGPLGSPPTKPRRI